MAKKKKKESKERPPYNAKTMKAFELMDRDVSIKDAHKLATGIEKPHPQSIYDLKSKYEKYLLSKESTVRLASKVMINTMKMKPVESKSLETCPGCKAGKDKPSCEVCGGLGAVITLIYPTHSNAVEVAKEVHSRIDPVVRQSMNLNINADVDPVDLAAFRTR